MGYSTAWPLLSPTRPFRPAPRLWSGNMCGIRLSGLPPAPGGASDPALVLSWLYDRYDALDRLRIRAAWKQAGYTHVALSWPDSRADGATPQTFAATVGELIDFGFFPCVFWASKAYDPPDVAQILDGIEEPQRLLRGVVPLVCIGWELSLWLTPTQVQQLIDAIAPPAVAYGARVYVHFQQGYGAFQQPGGTFADFWNLQVGKLTGVLHQRILQTSPQQYRYGSGGLDDILIRFAGGAGCVDDSGFGHPFDLVAFEITAQTQFDGSMSEQAGDELGTYACLTPAHHTAAGVPVNVMGSGNGSVARPF